jgi:hypothetical protein
MPVEAGALREAHLRACTEALLRADHPRMDCLRAARELALPDWALGAGLCATSSGITSITRPNTPLNDIDLIYLDSADPTGLKEADHEAWLAARMPGQQWEVRNQARMHLRQRCLLLPAPLGPQPLGGGAHLHRGPPAGR